MKRTRILMLGLGLAILTGVAGAAPALAQCFWCTSGPGPADGSAAECNYCVHNSAWGLDDYCTTPACENCEVGGQLCLDGVVMLDGRLRPDRTEGSGLPEDPGESLVGVTLAVYESSRDAPYAKVPQRELVHASTKRRRCDGGITARQYSAGEMRGLLSDTKRIRI